MENRRVRVGITHGDTNGVGYEVIFAAFDDPAILELCTPIIYGSPKVAAYHRNALGQSAPFSIINEATAAKDGRLNLLAAFEEEVKVELGVPTEESDKAAMRALERAVADFRQGLFDVLVTAPAQAGGPARLEQLLGEQGKSMEILVGEDLRVALVTNNVALKSVAAAITKEQIVGRAKLLHACLKRDLRLSNPRIAVLALNPSDGTEGYQGDEEEQVIKPAIAELEQQGVQAFGPYTAEYIFGNGHYERFDGVLAMYRDQGVAPFRSLVPEGNVWLTTGLSVVSTAPDHGPAFDIAGRGVADALSMRHAVYLAIDVARNRLTYDEPLANPLPKLYHEKRDDSEKVRFAVPKSKDAPKREHKNAAPQDEASQPAAAAPAAE